MSEQEAPITEAGRKLPDLSKAAQNRKHRYIIMDERGPESVLLGYKDYRGLVAATNLMKSPKALRDIEIGLEQLRTGEGLSWSEVEKRLRKHRAHPPLATEIAKESGIDAKIVLKLLDVLLKKIGPVSYEHYRSAVNLTKSQLQSLPEVAKRTSVPQRKSRRLHRSKSREVVNSGS